jgi:hypothetical protein
MNKINVIELVKYLTMTEVEFKHLDYTRLLRGVNAVTINTCTQMGGFYIHIDRGANILGVAHLDTVLEPETIWEYQTKTSNNRAVFGCGMDDRFGVYTLLHHLEKMGLKYDILLTTEEESMGSTAEHFTTDKQYNWIFQFDRTGTDVVMYDYETSELREMLEDLNITVGIGTYTCISEMEHLKAKGFNFGCGYYNNHSYHEYLDVVDAEFMIGRFLDLYALKAHVPMPHVPGSGGGYRTWGTRDYSDRIPCGWSPRFYPRSDEEKDEGEILGDELFDYPTYDRMFNYLVDVEGMDSYEAHHYAFQDAKRKYEEDEELEFDGRECIVCGDINCAGLLTCEICDCQYHNNRSVIETGLCERCWDRYIKSDEEV